MLSILVILSFRYSFWIDFLEKVRQSDEKNNSIRTCLTEPSRGCQAFIM